MKYKYFFIMAAVVFILFMGCEKENANSSDNISTLKSDIEKTSQQPIGNPIIFVLGSYEFQPVIEGNQVTHDFIVRNKGDGDLEISRVKTY